MLDRVVREGLAEQVTLQAGDGSWPCRHATAFQSPPLFPACALRPWGEQLPTGPFQALWLYLTLLECSQAIASFSYSFYRSLLFAMGRKLIAPESMFSKTHAHLPQPIEASHPMGGHVSLCPF